MLTIDRLPIGNVIQKLDKFDVAVEVRRATLPDESQRWSFIMREDIPMMNSDIAAFEMWLTVVKCDILDSEGKPLIGAGMSYEDFMLGLTDIWGYDTDLFWAIHKAVRDVNTRWLPQEESEGNE